MEILAGTHLRDALRQAVDEAASTGERVVFQFNDAEHRVEPGESYEEAKARAQVIVGHPILERDEEVEELRREREKREAAEAKAMAEAGVPTEQEMRAAEVPTPLTIGELQTYIHLLVKRPHDYGTCVYAMSMAAVAAFNFVARELGATGFQASCADLDILRRTRGIEHGFRIVDMGDLLYPQHWDDERTPIFQATLKDENARARFGQEARRLLANRSEHVHPDVLAHWERLAIHAPDRVES